VLGTQNVPQNKNGSQSGLSLFNIGRASNEASFLTSRLCKCVWLNLVTCSATIILSSQVLLIMLTINQYVSFLAALHSLIVSNTMKQIQYASENGTS